MSQAAKVNVWSLMDDWGIASREDDAGMMLAGVMAGKAGVGPFTWEQSWA